jgi:hypothetical protein
LTSKLTVLLSGRNAAANDTELCPTQTRWQQLVFSQRDRPASGANGCFGAARGLFVHRNATSIKRFYHSAEG